MIIQSVNIHGLAQIAAYLEAHHKNGKAAAENAACVGAYAADVEFSLAEGNGAEFEISAFHSVTRCPVVCLITPEGLDSTEVEIDE